MDEQTCENCRHYGEDKRSRFCVMEEFTMACYDGCHCEWWQEKEEIVVED